MGEGEVGPWLGGNTSRGCTRDAWSEGILGWMGVDFVNGFAYVLISSSSWPSSFFFCFTFNYDFRRFFVDFPRSWTAW